MHSLLQALARRSADALAPRSDDATDLPDFEHSPRQRLLERIEKFTAKDSTSSAGTVRSRNQISAEIYAGVSPADRQLLQIENQLAWQRRKCEKVGACLACCLFPCICDKLPPLKLSHRLWVLTHSKEVMRTTATGKLLLLAHPKATLLVSGVPSHDAELERLCHRKTAVVLFPAADACSPAELLRSPSSARPAAVDAAAEDGHVGAGSSHTGSNGACAATETSAEAAAAEAATAEACLDVLVLDGTWNQARWLFRCLPSSIRKVAVDCSNVRSLFGTRVRKQGAAREAAGRVSTLEAYCFLALALGDPQSEVDRLGGYLETFVQALPRQRPPPGGVQPEAAGEEEEGEEEAEVVRAEAEAEAGSEAAGGDGEAEARGGPPTARPKLGTTLLQHPTRSPTNMFRRRARRLSIELASYDAWREGGRETLASFLDAQPRLGGVKLAWRVRHLDKAQEEEGGEREGEGENEEGKEEGEEEGKEAGEEEGKEEEDFGKPRQQQQQDPAKQPARPPTAALLVVLRQDGTPIRTVAEWPLTTLLVEGAVVKAARFQG